MTQQGFTFRNGIGQRTERFVFRLREGGSLRPLGDVHPLRDSVPTLTHRASGSTVTRTLSVSFGEADSAAINFVSDIVDVFMVIDDVEYPWGRYRFTDPIQQDYADPRSDRVRMLTSSQLADNMSIVDSELETAFSAQGEQAAEALRTLVEPLDLSVHIGGSSLLINNSWMAGTSRRQVIGAVAELGGYLPPWFDNESTLQFRRRFDPTIGMPDFDFDAQRSVIADSVTRSDTTVSAPNRVVVISNGNAVFSSLSVGTDPIDPGPLMAYCDVASTAPHSIMHLGFVRPKIYERQVSSRAQAQEVADLLCLTQTIAETVELSTALDPRHDGWNTVQFEGERWLEYGWSAQLVAGGEMRHTLQRSYPASPEVLSGVAGALATEDIL